MPIKTSIIILRAPPSLAPKLTEIAFAAKRHWGYPERWIQTWAPLLTITPEYMEGHETYLAYIDEQPAGFCAISQAGERASLDHLWVLPEFMGRDIGKELLEHTLSRCKALGVSVLEIESDPNAQGFYEHMRAKKVGQVVGEIEGQARILPLLEVKL